MKNIFAPSRHLLGDWLVTQCCFRHLKGTSLYLYEDDDKYMLVDLRSRLVSYIDVAGRPYSYLFPNYRDLISDVMDFKGMDLPF